MNQSPFRPGLSATAAKKSKSPFSKSADPTSQQPSPEGPKPRRAFAWQPLTFRGVAAFAHCSFKRLFLVQFIFAAAATASIFWFFDQAWRPAVLEAVRQMPSEGEIRKGTLDWKGPTPQVLAEGHFLAFGVDVKDEGGARSPAQIEVLFREKECRITSLFGSMRIRYLPDWRMAFNQPELQAWWGAWQPWLVAGTTVVLLAAFLVMWGCLATAYFLPIWLAGFFGNKDLSLAGSWRLAGAALLPGALFLTGAIMFYGLGQVDLVRLLLAVIAHFIIGWIYVIWAVGSAPLHPVVADANGNPFSTPTAPK